MMCLMKKIQYFIAIAATVLLTATSCGKEDNPAPVVTVDQITISTGNGEQAVEVSLKQGETLKLATAVSPADAQLPEMVWYSDDATVATVSPEGVVTAIGKGTCTITVETLTTPKVTASLKVTVAVDEEPGGDEPGGDEPGGDEPGDKDETIPVNDKAVDQSQAEAPRR